MWPRKIYFLLHWLYIMLQAIYLKIRTYDFFRKMCEAGQWGPCVPRTCREYPYSRHTESIKLFYKTGFCLSIHFQILSVFPKTWFLERGLAINKSRSYTGSLPLPFPCFPKVKLSLFPSLTMIASRMLNKGTTGNIKIGQASLHQST